MGLKPSFWESIAFPMCLLVAWIANIFIQGDALRLEDELHDLHKLPGVSLSNSVFIRSLTFGQFAATPTASGEVVLFDLASEISIDILDPRKDKMRTLDFRVNFGITNPFMASESQVAAQGGTGSSIESRTDSRNKSQWRGVCRISSKLSLSSL